MRPTIDVHGVCRDGFHGVKDAFESNFSDHGEIGASLAVAVEGEIVVDLWGGYADAERTKPWEYNTIVNVYSTTKGLTALCANRLIEEGKLDPEAPVAQYWPEFAQAGKDTLPVKYLLSHRAGLPAIDNMLPRESQYQWIPLVDGLAAQRPWWEPGSKHGYHAVTFGHLVGEVIRRITGGSVGSYFRKQFAEPLGIDAYIGFGRELDDYCANVVPAPMQPPDPANRLAAAFLDPSSLTFKSFMITPEPLINPNYMNSREWRAAEIPAANGHANARALATIYGALANGGTIGGHYVLGAQTIQDARQEESYGEDAVLLGLPTRFGRGFMLEAPEYGLTEGARLFGHPGLGGSFGFADPGANVGIGYAMNKLILPEGFVVDPRWTAIMEAIYQAV